MDGPTVTLLGPRHRVSGDHEAVRTWPSGPLAWASAVPLGQESAFGRPTVDLELARRWRAVLDLDHELAEANAELRSAQAELQELYAVRLRSGLAAVLELVRSRGSRRRDEQVTEAVEAVRALDRAHLARVGELRRAFAASLALRDTVARHRSEIAGRLGEAAGLVIGGGHVGELLQLCTVFGLTSMINVPVLAWSAGAMVLGTQVLLFHDHDVSGRHPVQFYADGLELIDGVVLPDARRRLYLHDREHVRVLAARMSPQRGVLLDDRELLVVDHGQLPADARFLDRRGTVSVTGGDHGAE